MIAVKNSHEAKELGVEELLENSYWGEIYELISEKFFWDMVHTYSLLIIMSQKL